MKKGEDYVSRLQMKERREGEWRIKRVRRLSVSDTWEKKMREDERSLHRITFIYKNANWKKWEDFLSDKWNELDDCACVGRILKRLRIFDEKFAISLISDSILVKYHRFIWNYLFATIVGLIFFFKADEISRCVMAMFTKIMSNQSQVNLDKTIPGLFNRARYLLFQKKKNSWLLGWPCVLSWSAADWDSFPAR